MWRSFGVMFLAGVVTMGTVRGEPTGAAPNAFGLELFKKLAENPGNVTVSPVSIALALAMTHEGAVGKTREVMGHVLHLDGAAAGSMPQLAKDLATAFRDGNTVSIANAIWPAKGEQVHAEYVTKVKAYDAGYMELDYRADTEAARTTINGWVAERTAGKIPELLAKDDVKPTTPMVITNAVYLKAKWASPFEAAATHPGAFQVAGQTADVPTMHQRGTFLAADLADAKVLELPYQGDRLAMTLVLPKGGLRQLESKLTPAVLDGWLAALTPQYALVGLPKLKLRWHEKLKPALQAVGLGLCFEDEADFSAMRPPPPTLKIGEVIHAATMDVDEEGTEASAATAVVMAPGGAAMAPKLFEFVLDRPFLLFIRDRQTGAILFLARVQDPRAE